MFVFRRKATAPRDPPFPSRIALSKPIKTGNLPLHTLPFRHGNNPTRGRTNRTKGSSFHVIAPPKIILLIAMVAVVLLRWSIEARTTAITNFASITFSRADHYRVVFPDLSTVRSKTFMRTPSSSIDRPRQKDFGGLSLFPSKKRSHWTDGNLLAKPRKILDDPVRQMKDEHRNSADNFDSDFTPRYAPDDEYLGEFFEDDEELDQDSEDFDPESPNVCRRTAIHRLNFPTCNNLHELDLLQSKSKYLG